MIPSEIIFKSFCENAPVAMVAISPNREILYANNAFCIMLGYESEELLKKDYSCLFTSSTGCTGISKANEKVNISTISRISIFKKDGSPLCVTCKTNKELDKDGNLCFELAQFYEPIAYEEEATRFKSGLFEAILDSFPDVIYIKNKKSQFININKAVVERFGVSASEDIIGKTDFDFFTQEHAQQAFDDEQKILKTGEPLLNFEEKETWPDGTISYLSTSKMPLKNKKGEIVGTFGVSHDITDKKVHEKEIEEKTRILNAITSKMPVVIYKFRKGSGVVSLFGDSEIISALEESKVAKLKLGDSLSHFVGKVGSQKDKHGYFSFSSNSYMYDREWYFENFIFEANSGADEIIGLALDITERKHTEQKLKRDAKDLEKVNRELNQFAYIISHDLKAPLRAITNLSEWIQEDLSNSENEEVKENLKLLRGRVGRMENLINGILVYSRLSRSKITFEDVDSEKVIDEVLDYLMVPDKFKIIKSEKFPTICFSKVHFEQIISNLISNAVKYHDKECGEIVIDYNDNEAFHEFSIKDNGPGIDEEYHEKVFKIFQTLQARDSFESTGIGLTIVKKIIEEQGGAVRIESEKGKGAKFIFTIPKTIAVK